MSSAILEAVVVKERREKADPNRKAPPFNTKAPDPKALSADILRVPPVIVVPPE